MIKKLTKQQKILLTLLRDSYLTLGDITNRFYSIHTPKSNKPQLNNIMKRNSKMSGWLNNLWNKELIEIDHCSDDNRYRVTQKAINLLNL
jgi:hypothetical protein